MPKKNLFYKNCIAKNIFLGECNALKPDKEIAVKGYAMKYTIFMMTCDDM